MTITLDKIQNRLEEEAEAEAKKIYSAAYTAFYNAALYPTNVKVTLEIPNDIHKDPECRYSKSWQAEVRFHDFMEAISRESIERLKATILERKIHELLEAANKIQELTSGLEDIQRG